MIKVFTRQTVEFKVFVMNVISSDNSKENLCKYICNEVSKTIQICKAESLKNIVMKKLRNSKRLKKEVNKLHNRTMLDTLRSKENDTELVVSLMNIKRADCESF